MHVVDASVWVSRYSTAEQRHGISLEWFRHIIRRGESVAVPALALAEVSGALSRMSGDSQAGLEANRMLQDLYFVRLVTVDAALAELGAVTASNFRLRGADALYVALAVRLGAPLITWDDEQRQRGGGIVQAMTPQQALEA